MLNSFAKKFENTYALQEGQNIAVACSGGVDSMVLCHLLLQLDIPFCVLHCNFHLRGEDSNDDAAFVRRFAEKHLLEFDQIDFDTRSYAKEKGISIQMAARELRYEWFDKIKREKNISWVATAHHLDDDIETVLINIGRGTGIRGVVGIPDKDNGFIRPLLSFTKEQILRFAEANNIVWREDKSNLSTDYLRNYLRHKVIPVWKEEVSDLPIGFKNTKNHLMQTLQLQRDYLELIKNQVCTSTDFGIQINLNQLNSFPNTSALLYELLFPFGFTAWEDIFHLENAQSGKMILSDTHRLIKDRDNLLLSEKQINRNIKSIYLRNQQELEDMSIILAKLTAKVFKFETKRTIFVSEKKISFPLELRRWKAGDFFYPAGMTGKKKLSKYFKDEKYSLLEKEAIWVLCCKNEIVWVVGHRADRRFLPNKPEEATIKITI